MQTLDKTERPINRSTIGFKAVIFDMDGLMLDTERVERVACYKAASEVGCQIADEVYLRLIGRNSRDTRAIFAEHYGETFPYEALNHRWRQCRDEILATEGLQLKPGLLELIDHLDPKPVRLAVATSTTRARATRLLSAANLLQRFEAVVCGDDVAQGKPAPDIFLKAAEALGVQPRECLVLEDSEAGILASHAAGMSVICVPDLKPPAAEVARLAHAVCTSLHEVRLLL